GDRGVGQDDREIGEVGGHVIQPHRVRVAQPDAAAAGEAGADAGLAGVEQRRDAEGLQLVVEREVAWIVRLEALQARVELEAADASMSSASRDRRPWASCSTWTCMSTAASALRSKGSDMSAPGFGRRVDLGTAVTEAERSQR